MYATLTMSFGWWRRFTQFFKVFFENCNPEFMWLLFSGPCTHSSFQGSAYKNNNFHNAALQKSLMVMPPLQTVFIKLSAFFTTHEGMLRRHCAPEEPICFIFFRFLKLRCSPPTGKQILSIHFNLFWKMHTLNPHHHQDIHYIITPESSLPYYPTPAGTNKWSDFYLHKLVLFCPRTPCKWNHTSISLCLSPFIQRNASEIRSCCSFVNLFLFVAN